MALSIKDEDTDRLVRRYARIHRTSYTRAINMAVAEALKREGHAEDSEERDRKARLFLAEVRKIQERVAALPMLDPRDPDEILYDADGLPK
jgi:antitoxin VapB